jgi:hypothetical protein
MTKLVADKKRPTKEKFVWTKGRKFGCLAWVIAIPLVFAACGAMMSEDEPKEKTEVKVEAKAEPKLTDNLIGAKMLDSGTNTASVEFSNLTDKTVEAGVIVSMTVAAHDGKGEVVDMFAVKLAPGEKKIVNGKGPLAMGEYDISFVEQVTGSKKPHTVPYVGTIKITKN